MGSSHSVHILMSINLRITGEPLLAAARRGLGRGDLELAAVQEEVPSADDEQRPPGGSDHSDEESGEHDGDSDGGVLDKDPGGTGLEPSGATTAPDSGIRRSEVQAAEHPTEARQGAHSGLRAIDSRTHCRYSLKKGTRQLASRGGVVQGLSDGDRSTDLASRTSSASTAPREEDRLDATSLPEIQTEGAAYSPEEWCRKVRQAHLQPGRTFVVMHLFAGERRRHDVEQQLRQWAARKGASCSSCRWTWRWTSDGIFHGQRRSTPWDA